MNQLDAVSKAVMDAAEADAAELLQEARSQAAERLASQKAAAEQESEARFARAARDLEARFARRLEAQRSAAGRRLLAARNARVQELFELASQQILAQPAADYRKTMQFAVERAAGGAGGRIRCHPEERTVFARIARRLGLELDSAELAERGGFIFIGPEFEVDCSLTNRLTELAQEMAPALAAELFG